MMTVFMIVHAYRPDVVKSKMWDTVIKVFNTRVTPIIDIY